jgi:macrolide transport system ATP-binding/permease protein
MSYINLCFNDVSFSYESSREPIIKNINITFPNGWSGIIGANGIGKTTLAKLATGIFLPDSGTISGLKPDFTGLYCEQTTEFYPDLADSFFLSDDNSSGKLRSILHIEPDWQYRWESLSHGERKRLQIAIMLWKNPDILALDEPTNHLDNYSAKFIIDSLLTYEGIGLLISHNRSLLDRLCSQCLFMDKHNAIMRPGGISEGLIQEEIENKNKEKVFENNIRNYKRIQESAVKLKQEIQPKERMLSKRHLAKKDYDGKGKIDAARLLGKDKRATQKVKQMETRSQKAKEDMENSHFTKRRVDGFIFHGEKARCDYLLNISAGRIPVHEAFDIISVELIIRPGDRIGLTGNNGAGKSTLVEYIIKSLKIPDEKMVYIPQELDEFGISKIKYDIDHLSRSDLGLLFTVIFRLGSEPERLLKFEKPSPGEIKKLMFGLGLLKSPNLLIMDEPTNHMDFPSIRCLEEALSNFEGAALLVSHDMEFIKNSTGTEWNIIYDGIERTLIIK